jgi:hypothetical protein
VSRRRRHLTIAVAAIVVAYALFVALIPLREETAGTRLPWTIQRAAGLFGLFAIPAIGAIIGAVRGVKPLLAISGLLCLMQAFVAFSGVTFGFIVPGIALLRLADDEPWAPAWVPIGRSQVAASFVFLGLTIGAWGAFITLTEPRCWMETHHPDGTQLVVEVPAAGRMTVEAGGFAGHGQAFGSGSSTGAVGCSSAEVTPVGLGISGILAIGAIAVASTAPVRREADLT